MPTPQLFRTVTLRVLLIAQLPIGLFSQAHADLQQFDSQISFFLKHGEKDSALYCLQKKSNLARMADSLAVWGQTQVDIHELFEDDYPRSLAYLDTALDKRWREPRNIQEWRPFMLLQANRGWFLRKMDKFWMSVQAYEQAAKIYEQFKYDDFNPVKNLYKALGNNYTRLGDNDKAIAVFQKALAVGGDNEDMSGLYANIGIAYWNKGDYVAAEEYYRKGLSLPGISNSKRGFLLGRLAETMLDLGRAAEAARTANEALRLLRPDGPDDKHTIEDRARPRRVAGLANTKLGKFAEAERLLLGALADDRASSGESSREVGKDHIALSKLYLQKDQALQAVQATDRALTAVIPSFQPINHLSNPPVTKLYEENTIFEALTAKAAAAQALFEKSGDIRWLELALECHELAWQAESILRRVLQYSTSKLHLLKDARAREEAAMNVARLLFEKTGQTVWLEKAFAIAERSKAALLHEALQDNLIRQGLAGNDKHFEEITALRQSLSHYDKNLLLHPNSDKVPQWRIEVDGIRAQIAVLEQTLRKEYPNLYTIEVAETKWLPIPADFANGEALVEYFISEHWVDIFVFQRDKPSSQLRPQVPDHNGQGGYGGQIWRRIPNDAELQSLIRRYLAFFENDYAILNDPAGYFQTAYTLWQKLLPSETATAAMLTILPDGVLNFVPFEALVTTINGSPSLRNAAYLLRQQEIRYAWSLAVLRQQKNLKSKASNYLLSIAPGFENRERGLAPLVHTDFDWNGITGWDIQKLRGQTADLQHFLTSAGEYRVLHFSTHAFAGEHPRIELMDSSLLLPDLYALPLKADLVMLSACETGLGKEAKGEGVMSLARAFAQAGAACIVSSLWSVNDRSTSRLLQYFYEKIGTGYATSKALREAKLAYLSDPKIGNAAQSPYFWAGLVAVGDDRVIEQPWGWGMWGILGVGLLGVIFVVWWLFLRRKH
ncbi:MAG: CHAT domain-containing protein [Saprospiraceae bacterium]